MANQRDIAASRFEGIPWLPVLGLLAVGAASAVLGPEMLTLLVVGVAGALFIALRPPYGVVMILFLLMVQYGERKAERGGIAGLLSLIPQGSGLFTPNNLLGLFLLLMIAFEIYQGADWSFLKNPILQLVLAITAVFVFSGFISGVNASEVAEVGLQASSGQDPSRLLVSRALFLFLFVYFLRKPSDLRMIVAVFIVLGLLTAYSGSEAGLAGEGRATAGTYRAGGTEVLIESTQNPNRLAMIATFCLVFIWEYSQTFRQQYARAAALLVVAMLVVTVFLTASRGGLIGLVAAGLMLFARYRGGSSRILYGIAAAALGGILVLEVVPEQAMERITNIPGISSADPNSKAAGEGSIQRRSYTYGIGLEIWRKAPIVGVGPGNWPYVRYMIDPWRSSAVAHNSYLSALAEGGVVTLTLYLMLFYITIRGLLRCEKTPEILARARADGLDWLLVSTRICLISFMVFSLFSDLWDLIFSYFLVGVSTVLIERYLRPYQEALPA